MFEIYRDGYKSACKVGFKLWKEYPESFIRKLMPDLYSVTHNGHILAVFTVSEVPNELVWEDGVKPDFLYVSRCVLADSGVGVLGVSRLFSLVFEHFGNSTVLRTDIFSENAGTVRFYESLGFHNLGVVSFVSPRREELIEVVRLELSFGTFNPTVAGA